MAYGSYYPTGYQPMYFPQNNPMPQTQAQPQSNNGLNWVQGEAGAKSYLVAPNTTVMLMDSENDVFYLKSTDASGMPMPLRIFDYKERRMPVDAEPRLSRTESHENFVTKDEFESFKEKIESFINAPIGKHEVEE